MVLKNFLTELEDSLDFVLFYGSQLGQAKSIAEGLGDLGETDWQLRSQCFELNLIRDVGDLTKVKVPIVIVTSTTGDGEPPENADKFWRKIRKKNLGPEVLQGVQFALLGLGDTNYNSFCNCGKEINRRLLELGASPFYSPGWADDAVGLDLVVDQWIDDLWPALESLIRPGAAANNRDKMAGGGDGKTALTVPSCPPLSLNLEWMEETGGGDAPSSIIDLKNPLAPYPLIEGEPTAMTLKKTRVLTKPGALKTALEVTLEFKEEPFKFEPGDAINIICPNGLFEVNQLLERLGLNAKANQTVQLSVKPGAKGKIPVFLPATIAVRDAFLYYLDIRSCPKKNFLRLLAEFTTDPDEKSQLLLLSSRQGGPTFEETVRFAGLSLLDLLLTYPTCQPPLEALLEHLPRLVPRAFSISSSPLESDTSLTFAFNLVDIPKEKGRQYRRLGVCTGWLYTKCRRLWYLTSDLDEALSDLTLDENTEDIIVYRRKNPTFRLPDNPAIPVIMVGPGTGVAPFVGFIQHRNKLKKEGGQVGPMTLYFGCRHKDKDFLYQEELEEFAGGGGVLTKLYPVFSRDNPEEKVKYVQHKMEETKEEVVKTLLEDGGYLYVCGDARNMAKDVRETLLKIVQTVKVVTEQEAKALVAELTTQKRYLQDVWT